MFSTPSYAFPSSPKSDIGMNDEALMAQLNVMKVKLRNNEIKRREDWMMLTQKFEEEKCSLLLNIKQMECYCEALKIKNECLHEELTIKTRKLDSKERQRKDEVTGFNFQIAALKADVTKANVRIKTYQNDIALLEKKVKVITAYFEEIHLRKGDIPDVELEESWIF